MGQDRREESVPKVKKKKLKTKSWLHPHEVLLESNMRVVWGGKEDNYTVTLTKERILLAPSSGPGCLRNSRQWQHSILSKDIVSVRPPIKQQAEAGKRKSGKRKKRGKHPVFMVVAFPFGQGKDAVREKVSYFFHLPKAAKREEVNQTAQTWVEAISEVCIGQDAGEAIKGRLPLLILINPASGKGQGKIVWQKVAPVLQEAGVGWEVVFTSGPGHGRQIVSGLDLSMWRGVVLVSGDGLVHEIYNGLMDRPDWRSALEFTVGVIPAGSGNALAHSLSYYQDEKHGGKETTFNAAINVARANTIPMDLFVLRTQDSKVITGFLSLGWGLIPDVDIDSEHIRWMGSLRFTIYGLLRIARFRQYRGTISYILADWPDQRTTTIQVPIHPLDSEESDWTTSSEEASTAKPQSNLTGFPSVKAPPTRQTILPQPSGLLTSGYAQSWQELDERLCTVNLLENGNMVKPTSQTPHIRSTPVSPTSPTPSGVPPAAPPPIFPPGQEPVIQDQSPFSSLQPSEPDPFSSPLTGTPLHKDWVTETSDYITVYLLNLPLIDRTMLAAPECRPNDGVLWLCIVRASVTRMDMMKLMVLIETGQHLDIPGVDIFPVTAVKIQPDQNGPEGKMTIDGESIPCTSVQAQILPSAARVMVK